MSEYEAFDLMIAAQAEGGRSFMTFVTVLFAYLVCTHFIGATLSRGVAITMSVLYSLFALLPVLGFYSATEIVFTAVEMQGKLPTFPESLSAFGMYMPIVVIFSGWALSLFYMWKVRRTT